MYLRCTYWGSDATNRVFYIQIDGNNIATQRLENNNSNQIFQLIYPVPVALTNGKSGVTVKFQAKPEKTAGGVFDKVEMLTYDGVVTNPTPTPTPDGSYVRFRNAATGLYIDGMGSASNGSNACQPLMPPCRSMAVPTGFRIQKTKIRN